MSEHSPDVLITPSKLTPLAKDVTGTLVVNPGTLVKGAAGGTYADLTIHPFSENKLRESMATSSHTSAGVADGQTKTDAGEMEHVVASRSYVNVVRI